MPQQDLLQAYAAAIREAYCSTRNRWHQMNEGIDSDWGGHPLPRYDGGMDSAGRMHRSIWERIARFIIEKRVSPIRYIEAQFRSVVGTPPEPGSLCSEFAYRRYEGHNQAEVSVLSRLFKFQKEKLALESVKFCALRTMGWTDRDVCSAVLQNTQVEMSALFRYCEAVRVGLDDVAEEFQTAASIQYLASPEAYDEVWGDYIPVHLKGVARMTPEQIESLPAVVEGPVVRSSRSPRALLVE